MKYKLYKDTKKNMTALEQILYNRGIPAEEQNKWLSAGWESINDWRAFGEKKMREAARIVQEEIEANHRIAILCDEDPDGATSTAIVYNFIHWYYPEYAKENVEIIFHKKRTHGLKDIDLDYIINNIDLLWSPDASTNDYKELELLVYHDVKVIITDHHLAEKAMCIDDKIVTVNNQIDDYPNKDLSGAGVSWQLCRAIEEIYHNEQKPCTENHLLDLVALGNLSDMMDYHSTEIRAIVRLGLSNLENKFMKELANTNDYIIQKRNGLNYLSSAFGITPFINCCFRSATYEEKLLVINAFFDDKATEKVPSTKRGCKGESVYLWEEAILVAQRVKRKQSKLQDELESFFKKKIEEENLLDNAILLFLCEPGEVDKNLAGLMANRLQSRYQKPCAVLTRVYDEKLKREFYRGSMRNYSLSERNNLKADLEATGEIEWCQGHENSAGLSIPVENIPAFIEKFNKLYEKVPQEPVYWVDYIWNKNEIDLDKIYDISLFDIYGQQIPESLICIENIPLSSCKVDLKSPDRNPTLCIALGDLEIMKFKSSQEEYEEFCAENAILTFIGKPSLNRYNGKEKAQLIIENFYLREEWLF